MQREAEKKRPREFTRGRPKRKRKRPKEKGEENGNVSAPANSLRPRSHISGHTETIALIHHAFDRSLSKERERERERENVEFFGFPRPTSRNARESSSSSKRRRTKTTTKKSTHFVRLEPRFLVRVSRDCSHASDDGLRCRSDGRLRGRRRRHREKAEEQRSFPPPPPPPPLREARDVLGLRFDRAKVVENVDMMIFDMRDDDDDDVFFCVSILSLSTKAKKKMKSKKCPPFHLRTR